MKFKRQIALLLLFITIISNVAFAETEYFRDYDSLNNNFVWSTISPKAQPGTNYFYRTLGFHATLKDSAKDEPFADMYFIPDKRQEKEFYQGNAFQIQTDWTNLMAETDPSKRQGDPSTWNTTGIYEEFIKKYRNSPTMVKKITEYFAQSNILYLDAVLTKKHGDNVLGSMTVNNGWATFSGPIYQSYDAFSKSDWKWSKGTLEAVEKNFFGIDIHFDHQAVGDPIPKIQRSSPTPIDSSYIKHPTKNIYYKEASEHRFKEGEVITLDSYGSYFPSQMAERKYYWTWQKEGSSTVNSLPVDITGSAKLGMLPTGMYNVTLKTSAWYTVGWSGEKQKTDSKVIAKTKLIIEDNLKPRIFVNVTAPESVKYEQGETTKKIKATLDFTTGGILQSDITSVYVNLKDQANETSESMLASSLSGTFAHEFSVYYDKDRNHAFEGYAILNLKNGKTVKSDIGYANTYIFKNEIIPTNEPPIPILNVTKELIAGSDAYISGSGSFDTDGTITHYELSIPSIGFYQSSLDPLTKDKKTANVRLNAAATYTVYLKVTDDDGATAETSDTIKVTPPTPSITIGVGGTLKENRKVTFSATNASEFLSPVGQNYTWTITAMDVGIEPSTIKMATNKGQPIDVLFKSKGRYSISVSGTNGYGMTGKSDMIIDVSPDLPPIAKISVRDLVYRDDSKKAVIDLADHTYSTDGDLIDKRTWYYRFDNDNDGSFDDEGFIQFKDTADYTDNMAKLETWATGKYQFKVVSKESFGQETIATFITAADYRQAEDIGITTVDNLKPKVGLNPINDRKIDISLMTDYEGQNLLDVEARLNQFKRDANDVYQNVNVNIISDKKYVGRYLNKDASGYTNVQNVFAPKYQIANWNGLIEYSDNSYTVTVSTTRRYTNETVTTNDYFPSRVKQSISYNRDQAKLWLLENGDLYFAGTNSANDFGFWGGCAYAMKPTKVLTSVKQIEGGDNKYFLLQTNGEIYVVGHSFSAFYGAGMSFVKMFNQLNWSGVIGYGTDTGGNNQYYYNTHNTFTGDTGIAKVNGISNIDYIWSNGTSLVAKRTDGKWFGFGSGLNAFGLSTGFKNVPRKGLGQEVVGNYPGSDVMVAVRSFAETWYYLDNQNNFVELTNLSNLNSLCGGIKKVEPNKAYARNGNVYTFQETPTTLFEEVNYPSEAAIPKDGRTYEVMTRNWDGSVRVFFNFQVIKSVFGYQGAGTWQDLPKERKTDYVSIPADTIKANGVDRTPYVSWIKEPLSGQTFTVSNSSSVPSAIPDTSAIAWIGAKESTLYEYMYVAYTRSYTHIGSAPDPNFVDEEGGEEGGRGRPRGGYIHTYSVNVGQRVLLGESSTQAGFRAYALDASKVTQMPLREGSERYLIYLSLGDSFKNVNKSFGDYLKNNKVKARISTKAEYLDQAVDPSTQVNLRQTLNAVPNGKYYGEYGLEGILNDILAENQQEVSPDGATFALVNEDSIGFDKYYSDSENDPMLSDQLTVTHDPNYFESSQGLSNLNGKTITALPMTFDKVGKYTFRYTATDNPNIDNRFAEYRRISDPAEMSVQVHRRPYAVPLLNLKATTNPAQMTLIASDGGSVDADHQSEPERGITTVEWSIRPNTEAETTTWSKQSGNIGTTMTQTVAYGETYIVSYRVKDKENTWSYPVEQKILVVPQLYMDASLRAKDPNHTLSKLPVGSNVTFHGVWSSYQLPHHLTVQMYDGNTPVLSQKVIAKQPSNYWNLDGNDVYWNDYDFFIPSNAGLSFKTYKLKISAIDSSNPAINKFKDFYVTLINNNQPPAVNFVSTTPSAPYEGDDITSVVLPSDPDNDRLTVQYYLAVPGGNYVLQNTYNNVSPGQNLTLPKIANATAGQYLQRVIVSDGKGGTAQADRSVWVNQISITGTMWPDDPMSGDALYFDASTVGNVDYVEIILEDSVISNDKRTSMGNYPAAPYVFDTLNNKRVALKVDLDQTQLNGSFKRYRYVIWCTTPMSMTLKNRRERAPYTFIMRAWKGDKYRDYTIVRDLKGDVRQLLKPGIKH